MAGVNRCNGFKIMYDPSFLYAYAYAASSFGTPHAFSSSETILGFGNQDVHSNVYDEFAYSAGSPRHHLRSESV